MFPFCYGRHQNWTIHIKCHSFLKPPLAFTLSVNHVAEKNLANLASHSLFNNPGISYNFTIAAVSIYVYPFANLFITRNSARRSLPNFSQAKLLYILPVISMPVVYVDA